MYQVDLNLFDIKIFSTEKYAIYKVYDWSHYTKWLLSDLIALSIFTAAYFQSVHTCGGGGGYPISGLR